MDLQVDYPLPDASFDRLTDYGYPSPHRDRVVEERYIFGVESNAAVGRLAADPPGAIGAMDQYIPQGKAEGVAPKRVVRTRGHHLGVGWILLFDGAGDPPGWIGLLFNDAEGADGGFGAVIADADWVGDQLIGQDKVVEAHLGQVYDDIRIGREFREYPGGGDNNGAISGEEGVKSWVGLLHFIAPQIVFPGDLQQ